jgi:hypothetical protein
MSEGRNCSVCKWRFKPLSLRCAECNASGTAAHFARDNDVISLRREIAQIACTPDTEVGHGAIFALARDGSLWGWAEGYWTRLPDLPQE